MLPWSTVSVPVPTRHAPRDRGLHGILWRKVVHLPIPIAAIATPAMDENQGGRPISLHVVMNGNTVSGEGDIALRIHAGPPWVDAVFCVASQFLPLTSNARCQPPLKAGAT
jgi:hypothetical protein